MFDALITGGKVVDGSGLPWFRADVGIRGDRIASVGRLAHADAGLRIAAAGKVVAPGFIDAHVHGDLTLLADPYHEPAIRQGVTTYIPGQDGVAMAPGSPATLAYMKRYTAGFSGVHDVPQRWTSMADYLALFDRRCALNVACLIPNGNLRVEVFGLDDQPGNTEGIRREYGDIQGCRHITGRSNRQCPPFRRPSSNGPSMTSISPLDCPAQTPPPHGTLLLALRPRCASVRHALASFCPEPCVRRRRRGPRPRCL